MTMVRSHIPWIFTIILQVSSKHINQTNMHSDFDKIHNTVSLKKLNLISQSPDYNFDHNTRNNVTYGIQDKYVHKTNIALWMVSINYIVFLYMKFICDLISN